MSVDATGSRPGVPRRIGLCRRRPAVAAFVLPCGWAEHVAALDEPRLPP